MRKLIIDTDTGSDDAVAILMALLSDDIEVLAMTTVSGNAPLELATANCLQTMEITGNIVPVYAGADRPLIRERVHAQNVHGEDGMGDMDLIHPTLKAVEGVHAADAIIDIVEKNPNEVEIVAIGPVTNIALAILKAPDTMKKVKAIWTMGTAGFGPGNTTSVAEFNVDADAEAYRIMMNCGVPSYIGGFDICIGAAAWTVMPLFVNEPWSILGEMEIFCKIKNIATVTAITDCRLLLINQDNLLKWIKECPDFAIMMLDEISTKAVYITQKVIRLSSMTVDERVLDCLLLANEEGKLENMDKQNLCIQCCAPLRSINRSVSHWKDKGIIIYEKKKFYIPEIEKAYKVLNYCK